MKISLKLVELLADQDLKIRGSDLVDKIGSQLGAVEQVTDLHGKYQGIKIVEITQVAPHPDADKLNIYQIFDGHNNVQVVSGDTKLLVGDKVAWLAPGTTLPSSWASDAPLKLDIKPLRGQTSHGMFGSGKELDINDDASSVLVLDTDKPAGTDFAEAYNLNDVIIDIENKMFTHRPDCFGILGVAREIFGIQQLPFTSPDWYTAKTTLPQAEAKLELSVKNQIPKLVPRFVAVAIADITVGPSPLWLQVNLHKLGLRSINNIVDITNYVMLTTGQPLHAYDYDKVKAIGGRAELVVRLAQKGEKLTTINGKQTVLHAETMLVATDKTALGVGGIMGGADTEVGPNTKNIILEAATWDMYAIRRASMRHGLFTDAVTRFSKGQSPLQNAAVTLQTVKIIKQIAGGKVGDWIDDNHVSKAIEQGNLHAPVAITTDFINSRLGSNLNAPQIAKLLGNVEFSVEEHGQDMLVRAPFWRTDIEIAEDVVEEVGRLIGYDKINHALPARQTIASVPEPIDDLKTKIRATLAAAGANELQTYSFVPEKLLTQVGQAGQHAFKIRNALSPDLQHYRLSLTPSLLEKVHPNIKAGFQEFALFETNKVHIKGDEDCDGLPREYQTLALAYAAKKPHAGAPFYWAKKYLDFLLNGLGVDYQVVPAAQPPQWEVGRQVFAPFNAQRSGYIMFGQEFAGFIGEYSFAARKNLKLPDFAAGFELDVERLLKHAKPTTYKKLPRFPATEQDICFKVEQSVTYADLKNALIQAVQADQNLNVTITPLDIFRRDDQTSHKQITFRIKLQHTQQTLTTDQTNQIIDQAVAKVAQATKAERI